MPNSKVDWSSVPDRVLKLLGGINSDDPFGKGDPVRVVDGPEGAAWEVARRLGGDPMSRNIPEIARDINDAMNRGMSVEEAKDYARDRAVDRDMEEIDKHPGQIPGVEDGTGGGEYYPPDEESSAEPDIPEEQNASADFAASPEVQSFRERIHAPVNDPGLRALMKPTEALTRPELQDLLRGAIDRRQGDPMRNDMYDKADEWHRHFWGNDDTAIPDPVNPREFLPLRSIPDQPAPLSTPEGDFSAGLQRVADHVERAGQADGMDNAVRGLQMGLNRLNGDNPLEIDGRYGPQTDTALKRAVADVGASKVQDALALGRFSDFSRQAEATGDPSGLDQAVGKIMGPLYNSGGGATAEAEMLQHTLNDLGPETGPDWTPITVDGRIGPETTDAFGKVLKAQDADTLTNAYARNLGLE